MGAKTFAEWPGHGSPAAHRHWQVFFILPNLLQIEGDSLSRITNIKWLVPHYWSHWRSCNNGSNKGMLMKAKVEHHEIEGIFLIDDFQLKKKKKQMKVTLDTTPVPGNTKRNSGRIPRGLLGWERWWKLCLRTKRSRLSCSSWHLPWPRYRVMRKWV